MDKKKFYMTTAIAYTSGKPHIGNTYEIVLADSIARFKRQQGYDVFFQTGTDEHGQKIELKAEEKGVTPKAFVDEVSTEIKRIWDLMNTSTINLSVQRMQTTKNRYRRSSKNCTIREIFTRDIMKVCTVHLASLFLPSLSWWTANVRTADVKCSLQKKKLISSV